MCSRCGAEDDAHDYRLGNATIRVGEACWEELTGRPYADPGYAMAGRVVPDFASSMRLMQERKAKIVANREARRLEACSIVTGSHQGPEQFRAFCCDNRP